ncbi:unnamed protein product, partial [Sphacelaria rigidula]
GHDSDAETVVQDGLITLAGRLRESQDLAGASRSILLADKDPVGGEKAEATGTIISLGDNDSAVRSPSRSSPPATPHRTPSHARASLPHAETATTAAAEAAEPSAAMNATPTAKYAAPTPLAATVGANDMVPVLASVRP